MDSVTGALVPVTSTRLCHQFGLRIGMTVSQAAVRPLSRQVPNRPRKPQPEQALAVRGDPLSGAASNTLVLYVDSSWDQETALALKGALEISPGRDKALTLLVLFKEGLPDVSEARIAAEVEAVGHSLGVPTVVNEDVRGGWAGALVVPAGSVGHSWRLMAPGGGVTWMHQGRISAHELAAALDHYLIPSQPSKPTSLHPTVAIGMRISPAALVPDLGIQQAHCPPPPIRGSEPRAPSLPLCRPTRPRRDRIFGRCPPNIARAEKMVRRSWQFSMGGTPSWRGASKKILDLMPAYCRILSGRSPTGSACGFGRRP